MRWMRGLRLFLCMSCRDAALLISQATDRQLPPWDRAAVRLHLSICRPCRRFRGQLSLLRRILILFRDHPPGPDLESLPTPARSRIRLELERRAETNS